MPQPVSVFLRQSLMLRASWAACLDDPKPKPVRYVRSASRRIEATIELLIAKSGIADLGAASKPVRRSLRRIRRGAGEVRDLDVHRELLAAYGKSSAASRLDRELRSSRKKVARRLQERLGKEERKMRRALDHLETALEPALDLTLSGGELADIARRWFANAVRALDIAQDDQLHSVRKVCKTARYLAEQGAEDSKDAAGIAARFEAVQQTLGDWHDHLLLLQEARSSAGDGHELVKQLEADSRRIRRKARVATERLMRRFQLERDRASEAPKDLSKD